MRRKILAGIAAAAIVTGGTVALTESPAEAHPGCVLLHIRVQNFFQPGTDLLHFCVI